MHELETKGDALYIDGKKVIRGWESFSGWYWFATELENEDWNGAPLWYGLVQGFVSEWGSFSEAELNTISNVWPIKDIDLPYAGRRS